MRIQLIITLLVALVLILMTAQNPNPVSLKFLSWGPKQVPLIIIILISLLVGIVVSLAISLANQSRLREEIRGLRREIEDLKQSSPPSHGEKPEI